ncbi:hypothetical protein QPM04_26395, partial [Massilia varians]
LFHDPVSHRKSDRLGPGKRVCVTWQACHATRRCMARHLFFPRLASLAMQRDRLPPLLDTFPASRWAG